tara:strand:- start:238 stop:1521 length:1284 start_codon:yes stop_codon:yes gene_type:complete
MIKYINCNKKSYLNKLKYYLSKRSSVDIKKLKIVDKIINDVKKNGDKALAKYEKKFTNNSVIKVDNNVVKKLIKTLKPEVKRAIDFSYNRIIKFHSKQKVSNIIFKDYLKNRIKYKYVPLDSVGIYVPGGNASFPSTVLMNAIPAKIAGVRRIAMINPAKNGNQSPGVLYAAKKCGIKEIYSIGGAQSIAAIAFGTKKIKKVDKVIGPGNIYVANAKKKVFGEVGIDMIAGPSEITIVGDRYSNPEWIAADLIGQAEHDTDSQCILISKNIKLISRVKKHIIDQLNSLPRKKIAEESLKKNGLFLYSNSDKKIIETINFIAPEHLELNLKNYNKIGNKIKHAGSICLGKYSAMAITDYNAGSNHILPTNSTAKFSSGLSVYDFYKRISLINLSKKGIETIGEQVINLANYEGLVGHARSVEVRIRRK